ncbi:MAG: hypothetical protein AVDCRST_MAG56-3295, partial [uncultured Cytophagales bacterium]
VFPSSAQLPDPAAALGILADARGVPAHLRLLAAAGGPGPVAVLLFGRQPRHSFRGNARRIEIRHPRKNTCRLQARNHPPAAVRDDRRGPGTDGPGRHPFPHHCQARRGRKGLDGRKNRGRGRARGVPAAHPGGFPGADLRGRPPRIRRVLLPPARRGAGGSDLGGGEGIPQRHRRRTVHGGGVGAAQPPGRLAARTAAGAVPRSLGPGVAARPPNAARTHRQPLPGHGFPRRHPPGGRPAARRVRPHQPGGGWLLLRPLRPALRQPGRTVRWGGHPDRGTQRRGRRAGAHLSAGISVMGGVPGVVPALDGHVPHCPAQPPAGRALPAVRGSAANPPAHPPRPGVAGRGGVNTTGAGTGGCRV